jgi:hypothetical protein
MDSQPTDEVEGVGDDFVRIKKKRNKYERTVKAYTPAVTVTETNEQYCAPWIVESPGGTVTTSAYHGGKKRCLSAEGGSGDPRKKISEQNKTFMRAHRKGHRLSEDEIRAEAHKRQKEMLGAARAAAMTEEEVALEKLKGLAEKAAARRAATGQANKDKYAAEEAKRKAATGQAGKVKRAAAEAARKATTGQAGAIRWAKKRLQRLRRSKKRPRITQRWKSTSTEMTMPGITNACSPPPRAHPI